MSVRKTGSRLITVNDVQYRWRIRRKAPYDQWAYGDGTLTISIERANDPGSVLVAHTNHPHPESVGTVTPVPITPRHVAECIRQAIAEGWKAERNGPPCHFLYESSDGDPFLE